MIAYAGAQRLARGETSGWDLNAEPTEIMRGPIRQLKAQLPVGSGQGEE